MSETRNQTGIEAASVSDRGLNEKRPHNEDSFLLDPERRIFVVADGVGGANAGEVASKTAVDVLAEAFRQHQPGEDAEDLLEIAIQRANELIYRQSREQKQLASMATTVVALHLDDRRATIGHVGDSRVYRLDPAGRIHRETEDHSVVEDEVRAGRMTPEQAATHPSRNVINRALGAEASVEVDLKTFEVEEGTIFLLCSDGITRHIPDAEIASILAGEQTLEAACDVMKRRCFERGAEDNLTAVAVRLGARTFIPAAPPAPEAAGDEDTLANARRRSAASAGLPAATMTTAAAPTAQIGAQTLPDGAAPLGGPGNRSRIAGELKEAEPVGIAPAESARSPVGRAGRWLATLLLLLVVGAAAFYGGLRYQRAQAAQQSALVPAATPQTDSNGYELYQRMRGRVDDSPSAEAARMAGENQGRPLDSTDPVFLSLYGRALLLSGRDADALHALRLASQQLSATPAQGRDPVSVDTRLALAAAAVRAGDAAAAQEASQSLSRVVEGAPAGAASPAGTATPSASASPQQSPTPLQ